MVSMRHCRKLLIKQAKALPNEDAYATPYSILIDMANGLGECIKELKPAIKEAKAYRKQNPDQFPNRAKKWCVVNDSRRKQSASTEEADCSEEKPC